MQVHSQSGESCSQDYVYKVHMKLKNSMFNNNKVQAEADGFLLGPSVSRQHRLAQLAPVHPLSW